MILSVLAADLKKKNLSKKHVWLLKVLKKNKLMGNP